MSKKKIEAAWDALWEDHKKQSEVETIESMNAEGWKTLEQAASKLGLHKVSLYHRIRSGCYEVKKVRVRTGGAIRLTNFIRPKGMAATAFQ